MKEHLPALLLAFPLIGAFVAPILGKFGNKKILSYWLTVLTGIIAVIAICLLKKVVTEGIAVYVLGGEAFNLTLPSGMKFPIRIILEVDAMSAFMALSGSVVSFAASIYAIKYMEKFSGFDKFVALYFLLTLGMLGMETTGDAFNFFVFLEIASIASFGLIAFWKDKPEPVEASFKYMVVSTFGALLVLFAVGFLYGKYGVLNFAAISKSVNFDMVDKVALILLFSALAMKCGAVPMHMWLPDAYSEAPSCISAFLVSVSQASLYGLFRISYSLYGLSTSAKVVGWIIIVLGVLSMFIGVTMAIVQKEIKRLMAYHAISQTGYMLLGVGVGLVAMATPGALEAYGFVAIAGGLYHIINHAMYKGLLFLTAGALYYATGTRNLNEMGGLARNMPYTTVFFMLSAAAIAGLPPVNGFTSKLLIYESSYALSPVLTAIAMVTSVLTLASFVKIFHSAFLGPRLKKFESVREVPKPMVVGMAVLAVAIILLSLFPSAVLSWLVEPAARALVDKSAYIVAVMGGGM